METTNIQLIPYDDLGKFAPAKSSFNVTDTTVMTGVLRKQVTELNKTDKKEQADAITKSQTFTVNLDFTRMPLTQIIKLAANPQSIIVSLQNGLLRPLGDETLKKIARGDEVEIKVGDDGAVFHAKNKVVYVTVKTWVSRAKSSGSGMSKDEKMEKAFGELSEDGQYMFIAKRFMAKDDKLSLEDAIVKAKSVL